MKAPSVLITAAFIVVAFACKQQQKNTPELTNTPGTTETKRYVVPKDSMAEPKVIPAAKPQVVPAGKPTIVPVATNIHPVGNSQVILVGTPRIQTPGQDSFSLPKKVPAIGKTILAGSPEVIIARDALAKDQNSFNFSSFGINQGLINDAIFSILKDKKGNLWVGTYGGGVCKYDGVSFTCFTDKEGLGSNVVVSILEDKNENIWFGTLGGGLCKYDGKTFTLFTEKDGLGSDFIHCMTEDKAGNLWIGTANGGLIKYNPADRDASADNRQKDLQSSNATFTRFTVNEGLSSNTVASILEDKKGNLWIGTFGGARVSMMVNHLPCLTKQKSSVTL